MADADPPGQLLGLLELARGQAVGDRRHGDRGVAERLMSGLGDDRAVDPPREGDRHPAVPAQGLEQPITVGDQRWFRAGP